MPLDPRWRESKRAVDEKNLLEDKLHKERNDIKCFKKVLDEQSEMLRTAADQCKEREAEIATLKFEIDAINGQLDVLAILRYFAPPYDSGGTKSVWPPRD